MTQSLDQPANQSDLDIKPISRALLGRDLDVVVSGSIGSIESVRFIRSLRRLGAAVHPWLTSGGAQFVTETALSWAAANQATTQFSGTHSHIASRHGVIVSPASANMISSIAQGRCDSPATALIQSYLGQKKPVLILPNMHESLACSPAVQANLSILKNLGVTILDSRQEEGKRKFPEPAALADEVSHRLNRLSDPDPVLVTMGSTRGYLDDVRYVSNYSSGKLGSLISEELYRLGLSPKVICGSCEHKPKSYSAYLPIQTNDELEAASQKVITDGAKALVMAASVLDYVPSTSEPGKRPSGKKDLQVSFRPTKKIIAGLKPTTGIKVGFKLETDLTEQKARAIAKDYLKKYGLSLLIVNDLGKVSSLDHQAWAYTPDQEAGALIDGKHELAEFIAAHVYRGIGRAFFDQSLEHHPNDPPNHTATHQ